MSMHIGSLSSWLRGFCLAAALLLATAGPIHAAPPSSNAAPVFAQSWRSFFSGQGSRGRIIPICALCMALALFILIKKFAPAESGKHRMDGLKKRQPQDAVREPRRSSKP